MECRAIHSGSPFGATRGRFKVLMARHSGTTLIQSPGATHASDFSQHPSGYLIICALRLGTSEVGNSPDA